MLFFQWQKKLGLIIEPEAQAWEKHLFETKPPDVNSESKNILVGGMAKLHPKYVSTGCNFGVIIDWWKMELRLIQLQHICP